jgi:hypothetical protein
MVNVAAKQRFLTHDFTDIFAALNLAMAVDTIKFDG